MTLSPSTLQNAGLSSGESEVLCAQVRTILSQRPPSEAWQLITAGVLSGRQPFAVHRLVRESVFELWDGCDGPAPLWMPTPDSIASSNLGRLMQRTGCSSESSLHEWSVTDPEAFWTTTLAELGIRFRTPPRMILGAPSHPRAPAWLDGARFNIVESCFQAPGGDTAIIFGSAAGDITTTSYNQLHTLANRLSNSLRQCDFAAGDAIAIIMDLRPESVAIYLGIVQAGGVVVSIPESFAPAEIRRRLDIAGAKAVFTTHHLRRAGRTLAIYEKVIEATALPAIVLEGSGPRDAKALRPGDISWESFLTDATQFTVHEASPGDVINVLFSSGTTGDPKAIPWTHNTPIKCASDGYYHHDLHPGDVVSWPTSLGWMMGPWLIFATLVNRGTIALYDDAPIDRRFGEFLSTAGVTMLGVVPTLVRQWRSSGCMEGLDLSCIRAFSSTGECSNPEDMHYLMFLAGYRPIIEYCGGTEIGGGYITSTVVRPNGPSAFSGPAMGSRFLILDESGVAADVGELFLAPPNLGLSERLLNADHEAVYFKGVPSGPHGEVLRRHGDQMQRLPGGYYRALGRADDTMNLGGIKVSSAEIERVLGRLPGLRDVAAIASQPPGGGPSRLVIYAVIDRAVESSPQAWQKAMQQAIRSELNPLFHVSDVRIVDQLPRTASNKVMRRKLRAEYDAAARQ